MRRNESAPRVCPRGCVGACELAKRKASGSGETLFVPNPNDPANPTVDRCWLMVPKAVLSGPEWVAARREAAELRRSGIK